MTITTEQERWAVALWVMKHQGEDGPRYILNQMGRLRSEGDEAGVAMWQEVGRLFEVIWNARGQVQ